MDANYLRNLTRTVNDILEIYPHAEISGLELQRAFTQKERATPAGSAIMNFCGLPNEKETMENWARTNYFSMAWHPMRMSFYITRVVAHAL